MSTELSRQNNKATENSCFTYFPKNKTINNGPLFHLDLTSLWHQVMSASEKDYSNPVTSQINSALWSYHISLIFLFRCLSRVRKWDAAKDTRAERQMKISKQGWWSWLLSICMWSLYVHMCVNEENYCIKGIQRSYFMPLLTVLTGCRGPQNMPVKVLA